MDIVAAHQLTGSYRGAAAICGTTHKTVKRAVARRDSGELAAPRRRTHPSNTDCVAHVIEARMDKSKGRISAKRLLPAARAAGYTGSARNFRRAVSRARAQYRQGHRQFRPWIPTPGEHLVIDWGQEEGLHIFCAVLAWSRYRFVRFGPDERAETTLALLAECLEEIAGVPGVVLADRMACLKGGVVAGVVVPTPTYVRFATHYGFRPDFCEAHDPESKGVVEALVRYAKSDLVIPSYGWSSLDAANSSARGWCDEVNAHIHSEIAAVPARRLEEERQALRFLPSLRPPLRRGQVRKVDKLSTVRIGSARYSVPTHLVGSQVEVAVCGQEVVIFHEGDEVARHALMAPGEASILDEHYGGPRTRPTRAVRPRTAEERAFLALGQAAEDFLRSAAAAGTQRLSVEICQITALEPIWGRAALISAIERATRFRRFKASDIRAILAAGAGLSNPTRPGKVLEMALPQVAVRPLSDYALEAIL
jgi:transposase